MALPTIAERNIEELNSFEKFDYFINLSSFYYLKDVEMVRTTVITNL